MSHTLIGKSRVRANRPERSEHAIRSVTGGGRFAIDNGLEFFNDIKLNLLKHFDITSHNIIVVGRNRRKDGKEARGIRLRIKKRSEVIKFSREIGFESEVKSKKLQNVVQK